MRNDIISFSFQENSGKNSRSAVVKIIDSGNIEIETIYVFQHGTISKVVDVDTDGRLSAVIGTADQTKIAYLFLKGNITNADYKFIEEMTNLKYLDMSECSNTTLPNGKPRFNTSSSVPSVAGYDVGFNGTFETIILPNALKEIPRLCFYGNKSLKYVYLPPNLKTIGYNAFYNCSNLTGELIIPDKVTNIGVKFTSNPGYGSDDYDFSGGAFYGCNNLDAIVIGEQTTFVGNSNSGGMRSYSYDNLTAKFTKVYSKRINPGSVNAVSSGTYVIPYLGIPKGTLNAYLKAGWDYSKFNVIEEVDFDKLGY